MSEALKTKRKGERKATSLVTYVPRCREFRFSELLPSFGGSVGLSLDITGSAFEAAFLRSHRNLCHADADIEALRSDWLMVGSDLSAAIKSIKSAHGEEDPSAETERETQA